MKLLKKTLLFALIASNTYFGFAENTLFDNVAKQYSFEAGYRKLTSTSYTNLADGGITVLFDYAWQLSGFYHKKAAFISVPFGYTVLFSPSGSTMGNIISYGWTVRHELSKDKALTPFLGYALLLNSLKIDDIDGKVFGHQTRFDFGVQKQFSSGIIPYIKLEYSMTHYPRLGEKKPNSMYAIELKIGCRYNRKSKPIAG